MILQKLRLNNFRCYSGIVEIKFATDAQRNTTVILGTNGAGKTSILQALNFALYGQDGVTSDSPLINNALLKNAREHRPAEATVTLDFSHGGMGYRLKRVIRGYLVNERPHCNSGPDDVSLTFTKADGNTERDPYPQSTIESLLPSAIRTFFLFDGDRIADFTKPGRQRDDTISTAVNDVLHIVALSRAVLHTGRIASEKRRMIDRTGAPAIDKTNHEINLTEIAINNKRRRLADVSEQLRSTEDRLDAIEQELGSILEVAQLNEQRQELRSKRKSLVERGVQLQRELSRAIVVAVPSMINSNLRTASEILTKYKSRHEIPARIAQDFLSDLLERGDCICGRKLDDNADARGHLERLMTSLLPDSLQDVATQLASRLRPLQRESGAKVSAIVNLLGEISKNGVDIEQLDREMERVGLDIDATAIERAKLLNREQKVVAKSIRDLADERSRAQREVDAAIGTKEKLEDRLDAEMAKREGFQEIHRGWIVAKECYEALQQAKDILEERLRSSLGLEATQILKNLVSDAKKFFFSEVKVDAGFLLRVLDNEGRDVRGQLSMGETQVSSLAFILAMTRLGGQIAPLVVDTPLARLDVSVRGNAARWLPALTPQLIFLVTDAEYSEEVRAELSPRLGMIMSLVPGESGTTLRSEAVA